MKNLTVIIILFLSAVSGGLAAPREYYELRTYRFIDASQEARVEAYLNRAFLPALHRLGIKKVGVFKPVATDSTYGKKLLVLIPFQSLNEIDQLTDKLAQDKQYLLDGKDYLDATYDHPPYKRIETIILKAFSGSPESAVPTLKSPVSERVYELRSYEGHTEKIYRNKVHMFNEGDEVGLFKRLGFNAIFYGEVMAGTTMPNLMYMTAFENQVSRDEHWKAFVEDPHWKKLKAMPEYQNNMSKMVIQFFRPTGYSDF
jgi:hypothetical protein